MSIDAGHPKLMVASQRWYRRLLILYPHEHRTEYGDVMVQLFHDQSCDAWQESRGWGLLLLWLRILPDLLKTSLLEHLANLKGKKFMLNKILSATRASGSARVAFVVVFLAVFGFVFTTATIVTFILPEAYASVARIKIDFVPATAAATNSISGFYDPELIRKEHMILDSEPVLDGVIEQLQLAEVWRKKFNLDGKMKTSEARLLLRRMLEIYPIRGTSLTSVKVYSDDKYEAAKIANAIVENYLVFRNAQLSNGENGSDKTRVRMAIIESAEASSRPVRPNKPLNIVLGAFIGTLAGLILGAIAALIVSRIQRNPSQRPPLPARY